MASADEAFPGSGDALADKIADSIPQQATMRQRASRRAWSTVVGAWLMQFCVVGYISAYGVMQTYYAHGFLANVSASSISWIGSAQLFLMLAISPVGGALLDRGYYRHTTIIGSTFFVVCQFMLSLAIPHHYYQVFLSQGLGMGIGVGLIYMPTFGLVSQHFKTGRGFAIGIVASGSSLGAVVFSIALNYLLNSSLSFGWAIRITSFMSLGLLVVGNSLLFDPPKPSPPTRIGSSQTVIDEDSATPKGKSQADVELAREPDAAAVVPTPAPASAPLPLWDSKFICILVMGFLFGLGQWFPSYYVQLYAQQHGIGSQLSFYALALMNLSAMVGRILPNWLGDRWGAVEVYIPCIVCAGAIEFAMLGCSTAYGLVLFTIFYGFFFGSGISLYLPVVQAISKGRFNMGKRMGIALFPVGVASLIGTPINGAILGQNYIWWKGVTFASVTMLAGAGCASAIKLIEMRKTWPGAPVGLQ